MSDVEVKFGAEAGGFISEVKRLSDVFTTEFKKSFQEALRANDGIQKELGQTERAMREVETSAKGMSGTFSSLRGALAGAAIGVGIAQIATNVVKTSAEFERLRSVLATLEGESASQARFAELKKFAAETPFDLQQVVTAFSKLKARGLDPGQEALRAYGNVAAGMGKSLDQFIEAVADSAVGQNERLLEFGIVARQEGDRVAFTFNGVTTTVARNSTEIQKYLQSIGQTDFAGAMGRQMSTLGGAFSNLGDAVATLADEIGQGGLSQAIGEVAREMSSASTEGNNWASQLGSVLGSAVTQTWEVIKTFGQVVYDVFTTVADVFRDLTGSTASNGELIRRVFRFVQETIVEFGYILKVTVLTAKGIIQELIVTFTALSRAVIAALRFDGSGFIAAMQSWSSQSIAIARNTANQIRAETAKADASLNKIRNPQKPASGSGAVSLPGYTPPAAAPSFAPKGRTGGRGGGGSGAGGGADNRLSEWREELQQRIQTELKYTEDSSALEIRFWEAKLRTVRQGSKEYRDIQNNLYQLRKRQAQEETRERQERIGQALAVSEIIGDTEADLAQSRLDRERDNLESLRELHEISDQEYIAAAAALDQRELQLQADHESRMYTIKVNSLRDQLALENITPEERRRINNELERLEIEHQGRLARIRANAENTTNQVQNQLAVEQKQRWLNILAPVGQAFDGFLQSMWQLTSSFGQAILQVGNQIVSQFISLGVQMLTNWIATEVAKTAATTAGVAVRTTTEVAGATASDAVSTASGIKQIAISAVKAAAGAYAAIAQIPVVGPFLAPAVAAAALYGVYRLGKGIFSARDGVGDVPYDDAPFLLHKNEMVLPADIARPLRETLRGAGPTLSGGASGVLAALGGTGLRDTLSTLADRRGSEAVSVHFNVSAMDGNSVNKFFENNKHQVAKAVKSAVRNGRR